MRNIVRRIWSAVAPSFENWDGRFRWQHEPVMWIMFVLAVGNVIVQAVWGTMGVEAALESVAVIAAGLFVRGKVSPPANIDAAVFRALAEWEATEWDAWDEADEWDAWDEADEWPPDDGGGE